MSEAQPRWNNSTLADRLGVNNTTTRAWLEKDSGPNGAVLVELCRLFSVTPWELYGYKPTQAEALTMRIDRLPADVRAKLFREIEIWLKGAESATSQAAESVHPDESTEESAALAARLASSPEAGSLPSMHEQATLRKRRK